MWNTNCNEKRCGNCVHRCLMISPKDDYGDRYRACVLDKHPVDFDKDSCDRHEFSKRD